MKNEFGTDAAAIKGYARWATRFNGPAIYGLPTPMKCTLTPNQTGYIVSSLICACYVLSSNVALLQPPDDIFQSQFILDVFGLYVKWCQGSVLDYGYMKGALALAAAAVRNMSHSNR